MTKPVALTPNYGSLAGNVPLSTWDGTYAQIQAAFNELSTYAVYAQDVGGVNTMVVTTAPLTLSLALGVALDLVVANTNTGGVTLNVNATGPVTVTDGSGAALVAGTLTANTLYRVIYDGTNWRASGTAGAGGGAGPGNFSTLSATGAVSGAGFNAFLASPTADIGSVTPVSGWFVNFSVTGVSQFLSLMTARNISIIPLAGTGLSVKAAGGAHSTQIADSSNNSYNAGYLGVPSSASTTAALADRGKTIQATGPIVIPPGVFAAGDAFMIFNLTAANINISSTVANVRLAGTTTLGSPRVLAPYGLAFVYFWAVNGVALSGNVT